MKFRGKKFGFYLYLFLALFSGTTCYAKEDAKKVYVDADQIVVTKEGIFAYLPGRQAPVMGDKLAFDENGLYLSRLDLYRGPCYVHNLWCNLCGGCGVLFCPMNCCCF